MNAAASGARPAEFAKVVLGADLLLQVGVLLGKLILQRLDLLEGDGILDAHRDLVADQLQEAYVCRIEFEEPAKMILPCSGEIVRVWAAKHIRRWEKSKFLRLWEKEKKAGRDPRRAFKELEWEP
jgi:hypothetical protein